MHINNNPLLIADAKPSEVMSAWIHHDASLTDKLSALKGQVDLEVICQEWVRPSHWDRAYLQVPNQSIFQREILMRSQGHAYWYARSLIPEQCYQQNPAFFKRLETESIRNLIFGNPAVERRSMYYYPVDPQCLEYYWVKKHLQHIKGPFWVRFAEFSLADQTSFYLIEILFPSLESLS